MTSPRNRLLTAGLKP